MIRVNKSKELESSLFILFDTFWSGLAETFDGTGCRATIKQERRCLPGRKILKERGNFRLFLA
jgi:hypothetical protein